MSAEEPIPEPAPAGSLDLSQTVLLNQAQTVSHYNIQSQLGRGGMGVVYRATDTNLDRPVALKFLPVELARDNEARQRFVLEAKAASALDHPNICTIHEIEKTADGRLFIAMAYYEGETLKERLARGPLPFSEALDIAAQISAGLAKAHGAGIVHRDIKPANLIVTPDGLVKILDFGLAKLSGLTDVTHAGSVVGTLSYMAPERFMGAEADQRSDLWSLGVVLYEMVTGRLPFRGEHAQSVIHAIAHDAPENVSLARPDTPAPVERIIMRLLNKNPEERYGSANEVRKDFADFAGKAPSMVGSGPRQRSRLALIVALLGVLAGMSALWFWKRSADRRWAREETISKILKLAEQDDYLTAYALATSVEQEVSGNPVLADLWPQISARLSLNTTPPGADVSIRPYLQADENWTRLGQTPLKDIRTPRGVIRVRFEKPGFDKVERVFDTGNLAATGSVPNVSLEAAKAGMTRVPDGESRITLWGLFNLKPATSIPAYEIGRYEVTNREYKTFVDAGGYRRQEYWKHAFVRQGQPLPWESAMREFRDSTDRPGPSTWAGGTYRDGQEDYPVSGVSWYEAAAFAEFTGTRLPTVWHWARAAGTQFSAVITLRSNFTNSGPRAVGALGAMNPFGTFDMAGNVREWTWNGTQNGDARFALGGAWNEPSYIFLHGDNREPLDRSSENGFRVARYADSEATARLAVPLEPQLRDVALEKPVSDEYFRFIARQFEYDAATPLDPRIEDSRDFTGWRTEKVTFNGPGGKERLAAYLYLPRNVGKPYQTLLYFPGANAGNRGSSNALMAGPGSAALESLIRSGRAILYPVYHGTYERSDGRDTWPEPTATYKDYSILQIKEARRAVDFMTSKPELLDPQRLGYLGVSWGANRGLLVLALEPRLKTGVFYSGGLNPSGVFPPEVDPTNFAPRVGVPVLMLNGSEDFISPVKLGQEPLLTLLGTARPGPAAERKHRVYSGGHGFLLTFPNQVAKETIEWLNKWLGSVPD